MKYDKMVVIPKDAYDELKSNSKEQLDPPRTNENSNSITAKEVATSLQPSVETSLSDNVKTREIITKLRDELQSVGTKHRGKKMQTPTTKVRAKVKSVAKPKGMTRAPVSIKLKREKREGNDIAPGFSKKVELREESNQEAASTASPSMKKIKCESVISPEREVDVKNPKKENENNCAYSIWK